MLNQLIEKTRNQMVEEAQVYGLTAARTVQISQELDLLLNYYHQKYIVQKKHKSQDYQLYRNIIQNITSHYDQRNE